MAKAKHLNRPQMHIAGEHIRMLGNLTEEARPPRETVKYQKGRILYNPFGFKTGKSDPTGEKRKKLLSLWPLHSEVIQVELEGDALLVYTAIV